MPRSFGHHQVYNTIKEDYSVRKCVVFHEGRNSLRCYNSLRLDIIPGHVNPIHILIPHCFMNNFGVTILSIPRTQT
jgi:hypothetical protein